MTATPHYSAPNSAAPKPAIQRAAPLWERENISPLNNLRLDGAFTMNSGSHASPLMPLRDRDLKVLVELFTQEEIESIEEDIRCNLMRRAPEPCWEDDPFSFLREYL